MLLPPPSPLRTAVPSTANDPRLEDAGPWIWAQRWLDLLFLHWRVPVLRLRPHVPAELAIDTFDGEAWVSLVLFRLKVRPRWLPFLPGVSNMLELNLRTYVRRADRQGIYFLNMLADNRLGILLARLLTPLPYRRATMTYRHIENMFQGHARSVCDATSALAVTFAPRGAERECVHGSADAWLLERYRLFVKDASRGLLSAHVSHPRWLARSVEVTVHDNTIGSTFGLDLSRAPDCAHYSSGVPVRFSGFRRCMD